MTGFWFPPDQKSAMTPSSSQQRITHHRDLGCVIASNDALNGGQNYNSPWTRPHIPFNLKLLVLSSFVSRSSPASRWNGTTTRRLLWMLRSQHKAWPPSNPFDRKIRWRSETHLDPERDDLPGAFKVLKSSRGMHSHEWYVQSS